MYLHSCADSTARRLYCVVQLARVDGEIVALSVTSSLLTSRWDGSANIDLEVIKLTSDRGFAFAWLLDFHRATSSEVLVPGVEYRGFRATFVATMGSVVTGFWYAFNTNALVVYLDIRSAVVRAAIVGVTIADV